MKIKIESGIPVPAGRFAIDGKLAALRNALGAMKVGDSFLWESNRVLFEAAKQLNMKITTRKVNGHGYRVWRVA